MRKGMTRGSLEKVTLLEVMGGEGAENMLEA